MSDPIAIRRQGAALVLTLVRPQVHNAFDDGLIARLDAALLEADADPAVRAVVLTGAGSTFSAGADLGWMRRMVAAGPEDNRADALRLAALMRTLNFLSKPTIARVNGAAYGGGVGLIACCDIAIGVEGAKFALSEVRLGLVPAVISPYVSAAIGARQARRLFVSGEVFDAAEALRIGLLHQCVPAANLDATVDRNLHALGKGGPLAQHAAKRLALRLAGMTPDGADALDREHAALIAALRVSPEGQEGLGAFLEKRPPGWVAPDA
ncbi:MAG: enoyl-CoA hydratase/isomerase family protein [Xanthomonadaceae bacterium]|nr:enoyl-CoA hydratase/isomerase family protein [Xanthomonadaceae bacterium]MDE1958585.1 enoyl-CoA hydratase/isomerase family protein [Xanthomonadaceae bacterium]MDE2177722.1 enoyl-CoA hydratase/isomerase family protein [Xanthomonadaceae bacterium]MDE2245629.1 enoyl-CoA hydratase/isomerase family protein [Xanthomonadaceae bacterium]